MNTKHKAPSAAEPAGDAPDVLEAARAVCAAWATPGKVNGYYSQFVEQLQAAIWREDEQRAEDRQTVAEPAVVDPISTVTEADFGRDRNRNSLRPESDAAEPSPPEARSPEPDADSPPLHASRMTSDAPAAEPAVPLTRPQGYVYPRPCADPQFAHAAEREAMKPTVPWQCPYCDTVNQADKPDCYKCRRPSRVIGAAPPDVAGGAQ